MSITLKFRHQDFQDRAANSVCEIFSGQPYKLTADKYEQVNDSQQREISGLLSTWGNHSIELTDADILRNIRSVQNENGLQISDKLSGNYNLTVEMETGTGKTFTYIKTIYELNRLYGWSKFIIVVPSIAIREGVYKTFQVTDEYFASQYSSRAYYFIYNSLNLSDIQNFATDNGINIMIINSQAFNSNSEGTRRIRMHIDEFQSRKPLEVIASVRPILIIDEPQSVEGDRTKEALREFNPLFTLRYSATPKERFNLVYRLDAVDAYNQKLVKRIRVTGISIDNVSASYGYLLLRGVIKSEHDPVAEIQFDVRTSEGIKRVTRKVYEGFNLYEQSGYLEEYSNGFVIQTINGLSNLIELTNGKKLRAGEAIGAINDEQLRRIQIRETIDAHLKKERQLFSRGIKVLSLFFIDEVARYRLYDDDNNAANGLYAKFFEEEYSDAVNVFIAEHDGEKYSDYLAKMEVGKVHAGYFSIDKQNRMTNSKITSKKEGISDDISAYDLIMKDKERLLSFDEPVRFIFSHSALREGWDNPNVFQICTLKNSTNDIRRRQEVGRGLRLAVNQEGYRIDKELVGEEVQDINELNIIASESYKDFSEGLQREITDEITRPVKITREFLEERLHDKDRAKSIYNSLIRMNYVNDKDLLTEKYYDDKANGIIGLDTEIIRLLDTVYNPRIIKIADARKDNTPIKLNHENFSSPEFQELWEKIKHRSYYKVDFDDKDIVKFLSDRLNEKLDITQAIVSIERGTMLGHEDDVEFAADSSRVETTRVLKNSVSYDLIGRFVEATGLTRRAIAKVLDGLENDKAFMLKMNPENFISRVSGILRVAISEFMKDHIEYVKSDKVYNMEMFNNFALKDRPYDELEQTPQRGIYNYVACESQTERNFAEELDKYEGVKCFAKIPGEFSINTPMGKYNPDWAVVLNSGYFIAETKGSISDEQLRTIEKAKAVCAEKHFKAVSDDNVKYKVVDKFSQLLNFVNVSEISAGKKF